MKRASDGVDMTMFSVGKTSLIHRFVNNVFSVHYKATMDVDILAKHVYVGDQAVSLQVLMSTITCVYILCSFCNLTQTSDLLDVTVSSNMFIRNYCFKAEGITSSIFVV